MGSQAKRRRENRKKVNVNPKRAIQKQRRKKAPRVASEHLRAVWDEQKTARRNIEQAGLLYDANQVEAVESVKRAGAAPKSDVVTKIELEANAARRDRSFMMRDDMVFLTRMISRHGVDGWLAMTRDPDNIYQLTPKQIRRLYLKCQKVPWQYNALMMACGLRPVPEGWSLDRSTEQPSEVDVDTG